MTTVPHHRPAGRQSRQLVDLPESCELLPSAQEIRARSLSSPTIRTWLSQPIRSRLLLAALTDHALRASSIEAELWKIHLLRHLPVSVKKSATYLKAEWMHSASESIGMIYPSEQPSELTGYQIRTWFQDGRVVPCYDRTDT